MLNLFTGLDFYTRLLLIVVLLLVLIYEAINGFHDTANAVATVIYTRAMQAQLAVIMAGIFNFFGVMLGGLSVAYTIVHLLPIDLLLNVSSTHSLAMIFSMLLAAIIWNLGTWYVGLPASSSHTLIGAIIGIGLTHAFIIKSSIVNALNIPKVINIFIAMFLSPAIGFVTAGLIIWSLRRYWSGTNKPPSNIHLTPAEREHQYGKIKPPFWTRIALILSAIGVNFSHGANDGQKGIGLIMFVLISVSPAGFVLNMNANGDDINLLNNAIVHLKDYYTMHPSAVKEIIHQSKTEHNIYQLDEKFHCNHDLPINLLNKTSVLLTDIPSYYALNPEQRHQIRQLLICLSNTALEIAKLPKTQPADADYLRHLSHNLLHTVEYAPLWMIFAVACAFSLGTMIGWQRVTITIGEKIGKKSMTYAQAVSAQLTAAISISLASYIGIPVSTTQLISSAVAGTMVIDGSGIQAKTVKHILLAWFLTLPISVLLSGLFYWISLKLL